MTQRSRSTEYKEDKKEVTKAEHRLKDGRWITLRKASIDDAETIVDAINQVAAEEDCLLWDKTVYNVEFERNHITRSNRTENTLILVAQIDGQFVGASELKIGEFRKNKHTAELGIILLKEFRRLGAGSSLIEEMLKWAIEKGIEKVCLSVFSTNIDAIALYEKSGFKVEAVKKKQIKIDRDYVDEILMAKFLKE